MKTVTLTNIATAKRTDIPKVFQPYFTDIKKAVSSNLHKTDKDVDRIITAYLNKVNLVLATNSASRKKTPRVSVDTSVKKLNVKSINTDTNRFQNRKKLNENTVNQIVENFNGTKLDPLIVWNDPKANKVFLLAGHHRLEAIKKLKLKTAPIKFLDVTEKEAIKYAKVESNANRTLETPLERSNIYRDLISKGTSKAEVSKQAKIEGKNANYILNLAYLNPKGKTITTLEQLQETPDIQNAKIIERISDWIGEARKKYENLTDAHEVEMFNFLQDKNASKRITTKSKWLQKIYSVAGAFDFDAEKPLNLKRFKYETEGEKVYNTEYKDIQAEIENKLDEISDIKQRFKDPQNERFVNPKAKNYDELKSNADNKISKLNIEVKTLQQKLLALSKNKSKYTNTKTEQVALFGPLKKDKTVLDKLGFQNASEAPAEPENTFVLPGEIGKFLQQQQRYQSLIIIKGPPHSSKSQMAMQVGNAFGEFGDQVAYIDGEQGGMASKDTIDSLNRNTTAKGRANIHVTGSLDDPYTNLLEIAKVCTVIVADSISELGLNADELNSFRKLHPNIVWVFISQVKENGAMYGGNKMAHNPTVIIECNADHDYRKRNAVLKKNRGNSLEPIYNIYSKTLVNAEAPEGKNSTSENKATVIATPID